MRNEPATHRLVLKQGGTGDTIALSALIRDAYLQYPTDIRLSVKANFDEEIFKYDDRVCVQGPKTQDVPIDYRLSLSTDPYAKYLHCAHASFAHAIGIEIAPGPPVPSLVLDDRERTTRPFPHPYGVVAAGVKPDMPVKQWPIEYFREVVQQVDSFKWVQVGKIHDGRFFHHQVAIPECENKIGCTGVRELMQLIYHAECVISNVSLAMVIASAFGTPCVAIGGGRENPWRYADMGVTYLDTIGQLPCCERGGCGCCVAAEPHQESKFPVGFACKLPEMMGQKYIARCMTMVTPDKVIEAIRVATSR